jgi:rhodanese-related sulfurtransferase
MAMDHADNVIDIRTPVEFSIEGRRYETGHRRQQAVDLLRLAGLDPDVYELWELRVHRPLPVRYQPDDTILIRRDARFVAVRMQAGVM